MSVPTATATHILNYPRSCEQAGPVGGQFPMTRFAAVQDVQYALTDQRDPEPDFRPGGVMLSELDAGEFAIIITGSFYSVTVATMIIGIDMEAIPDNPELCVRFSTSLASGRPHKSWINIRFASRPIYARFMQRFWTIFDELTAKRELILSRLNHIAYAQPSNFTLYCRTYLGNGYFAGLEDSEDPEDEGSSEAEGER